MINSRDRQTMSVPFSFYSSITARNQKYSRYTAIKQQIIVVILLQNKM